MVRLFPSRPFAMRDGRTRRTAKARIGCEALEEKRLLSGGLSMSGSAAAFAGGDGMGGARSAERLDFGSARQNGMFGAGALGIGGGARNPLLFLTAPLVTGSSTTPPSPSVMSSSTVQTALQTLETDLKNDTPSGAKPTHASIGQLQDDLESVHKGTLTGTAAQTAIQNDQAAILTSMGLTQTQITQIQTDQQALQSAITAASSSSTTSASTTSSTTSTTASSTTTSPSGSPWSSNMNSSAVQTAFSTLQSDLSADTPSGAQATHASIGQVQDDLDAIRSGTLTGTAAVTKLQTDTAAVLASEGLTATQITQIQTDQAAVETAIQANAPASSTSAASTSTSTTSTSTSTTSTTQATLQSVAQYLVGLPGLGGDGGFGGDRGGRGGFDRSGMGGFSGGQGPMGGF